MRRRMTTAVWCGVLAAAGVAAAADKTAAAGPEAINLLADGLAAWEVWMGVPHASVGGLPEGTYRSDDVHAGEPLGLGRDLKQTFAVRQIDGVPTLHVTGEVYGGLTTKASFADYHLRTEFRWGDRKWEPRLEAKRDSGILYHAHGEHGKFWRVWKACLEYQVQERDLGDFIPLGGPRAAVRGREIDGRLTYDPASDTLHDATGYTHAAVEPDAPHGAWNVLEIYVVGDDAVHVANGEVVMAVQNAVDAAGRPLTSGQIQLQSEAAECFYRHLTVTPLDAMPAAYAGLFAAAGGDPAEPQD